MRRATPIVLSAFLFSACGQAPPPGATLASPSQPEVAIPERAEAPNPLLVPFDTPWGAPPFHLIEIAHYQPAFERRLQITQLK